MDSGQDIEMLSNFGFGFSDATDRFVQMIERGGATVRIQIANCGLGLNDVFPRDETGSEFSEKAKLRGKFLQPLLSRQVNQRASRQHCS